MGGRVETVQPRPILKLSQVTQPRTQQDVGTRQHM